MTCLNCKYQCASGKRLVCFFTNRIRITDTIEHLTSGQDDVPCDLTAKELIEAWDYAARTVK